MGKKHEAILLIDENQLDKEWTQQPKTYYQYAEEVAKQQKKLDELKKEKEVIVAGLGLNIRQSPEKYDIVKVTESAVSAAIVLDTSNQLIEERIIEQKYVLDLAKGVLTALDHKKKALEKLVDLHGQNYFSTPRVKNTDSKKVVEKINKKKARRRRSRD